ncbi:hypothetical protein E0687_05645 [Thermus tengchongensis]|uniref:Uncharacterized protein n=1 Tax=Thermus tengchongensis TaxID=1214928 RepID=A0A4Y9FBB5_9DEIN|nr:hypothetical protein E0687_05645 [Thermus tengchongensis]
MLRELRPPARFPHPHRRLQHQHHCYSEEAPPLRGSPGPKPSPPPPGRPSPPGAPLPPPGPREPPSPQGPPGKGQTPRW